ncbi:hypothetical protein [Mesorhizobium sp. M0589]|uniref:hypothetical protein n=1 Tax=Mesorhizobium sp. M0589 TaxID=2956965 RepID=UPI003338370D
MDEMSKSRFTIAYDGTALREGTMDVRDLAPALLAVGSLFDAANRTLNGPDAPKISVNVVATAPGSFEIVLDVVQSLYEHARSLLVGDDVAAALNLTGLIFLGGSVGTSLVLLIRKLRGRKPDRIERLSPDTVRLTIDGESLDVPMELLRLYQDLAVRKALEGVVSEPLKKEGIQKFKVLEAKKVQAEVSSQEATWFVAPEPEGTVVLDDIRKAAFSIVSLAFKDDNKWRLHDGNSQISATIADDDFKRRVDGNEIAFSKGDVLVCEVKVTQTQTASGLKTEYTVVKVLENIPAMKQLNLPIEEPKKLKDDDDDERVPTR